MSGENRFGARRHRLAIAVVAAASFVTVSLSALAAPEDWTAVVVDSGSEPDGDVGRRSAIELDAEGRLHVGYYDVTNEDLKYASFDGVAWTIEVVDSGGNVGDFLDLALDSSGQPHISYYDATNLGIKYAVRSGTGWASTTVDPIEGGFTSIAIGTDDVPHISYWDTIASDLRHASLSGGTWSVEIVDSEGLVGSYTSIDIDASNQPHISYYDGTNANLKYATGGSGAWATETVDANGTVGIFTSLVVGQDGAAHISYFDLVAADLRYATNSSGAWSTTVVASEESTGWYSSIDIAADGSLHIAYYDNSLMDLEYAVNAGSGWVLSLIDEAGTVGLYPSIAVGPTGIPNITYYDLTTGSLKHASFTASELDVAISLDEHTDLDESGDISVGDVLAYTITAYNNGATPITNATVTDQLTGETEVCESPLPAGGSCVLMTSYTVQPGDVGTVLISTGVVASDQMEPVAEVIEVPVPSPAIEAVADYFLLEDADGTGDVSPGDLVGFTITATNTGDANLTNVVVQGVLNGDDSEDDPSDDPSENDDTEDEGTDDSEVDGGNETEASDPASTDPVGAVVTAECPLVTPGGQCTAFIDYTVVPADAGTTLTWDGSAVAVQAGPVESDLSLDIPAPELTLTIEVVEHVDTDGSETITPGDDIAYAITATNTGGAHLTNVRVKERGDETAMICDDPFVAAATCQIIKSLTIPEDAANTTITLQAGAVGDQIGSLKASLDLEVAAHTPSCDDPEDPKDPKENPAPCDDEAPCDATKATGCAEPPTCDDEKKACGNDGRDHDRACVASETCHQGEDAVGQECSAEPCDDDRKRSRQDTIEDAGGTAETTDTGNVVEDDDAPAGETDGSRADDGSGGAGA